MASNKAFPGRIIFDHLPKTAGQAINSWLIEALGAGCVTPNLIGSHRGLIRQYGGLYSLISAHVFFQDGEGLDPRYQYITFFREPLDRVVSWIFFVVNNHDDDQLPGLRQATANFIESDGQILSSENQDDIDMLLQNISNRYVEHFCRIKGDGLEPDDEKIANALAAIKEYDVVGLYDDMPGFLAEVAALLDIQKPEKISRVNVTNQRLQVNQISPELRERLIELNELDLQLYAEVVAWQAAVKQSKQATKPLTKSKWIKYNPVRERVINTPDLTIIATSLREGSVINHGQLMTFDVDFFLAREISELEMGIHIFDSNKEWAFGINSTLLNQSHQSLSIGSYRVSHHLIANLPSGKYTAGFAFSEKLQDSAQKELAWHDVMCEFQVSYQSGQPFAGYTYLPAEISLSPTRLAVAEMVVNNAAGTITALMPVSTLAINELANIQIKIENWSDQVWIGDSFRPVCMCYHWQTELGEMLVFDGLRTPLPEKGIYSGQSINTEMLVEAPSKAGSYILILTLVQERVGWFEDKGFEPARLVVKVIAT